MASRFANPHADMIHRVGGLDGDWEGALGDGEGLRCMEEAWLTSSEPEDFPFAMFDQPKPLRRSTTIPGALAELVFGRYQSLDGAWAEHGGVVWLGMIVSDTPGDGGRLLTALRKACMKCDLAMIGTPTPLKPRDWEPERPFSYDEKRLTYWYMRQGFRVVQDGSSTRVVFASRSSRMKVNLSLL